MQGNMDRTNLNTPRLQGVFTVPHLMVKRRRIKVILAVQRGASRHLTLEGRLLAFRHLEKMGVPEQVPPRF